MTLKKSWKTLAVCLAVPLAVGGVAALCSGAGMKEYPLLRQPPLSPPGWLFPVVWTVLYLLMGLGSYLVLTGEGPRRQRKQALWLYGAQLAVNGVWPVVFFRWKSYLAALAVLMLLWVLAAWTLGRFRRLSKGAGWTLAPYLGWLSFAFYLNLGVYLLN